MSHDNEYGIPYGYSTASAVESCQSLIEALATLLSGQEDLTHFQRLESNRDPITGINIMLEVVQNAMDKIKDDIVKQDKCLEKTRLKNNKLLKDLDKAYGPIPTPQYVSEELSNAYELGRRFGYRQATGQTLEDKPSIDEIATATDIDKSIVQAVMEQMGDHSQSKPTQRFDEPHEATA